MKGNRACKLTYQPQWDLSLHDQLPFPPLLSDAGPRRQLPAAADVLFGLDGGVKGDDRGPWFGGDAGPDGNCRSPSKRVKSRRTKPRNGESVGGGSSGFR